MSPRLVNFIATSSSSGAVHDWLAWRVYTHTTNSMTLTPAAHSIDQYKGPTHLPIYLSFARSFRDNGRHHHRHHTLRGWLWRFFDGCLLRDAASVDAHQQGWRCQITSAHWQQKWTSGPHAPPITPHLSAFPELVVVPRLHFLRAARTHCCR